MTENVAVTMSVKLEKMAKLFKTHRCALDFDHSFYKASFNEAPPRTVEELTC